MFKNLNCEKKTQRLKLRINLNSNSDKTQILTTLKWSPTKADMVGN